MRQRSPLLLAAMLVLSTAASAETMQRVRGTVTSLDGYRLLVDAGSGRSVTIVLAPDYGVDGLVAAGPGDVVPGRSIGALALRHPGGVLTARELHIFPDNLRGAGAGLRPSDLEPGGVTVGGIVDQGGLDILGGTLTLSYRGGESVLEVPPGVPIVRFAAGSRSMLAPGAHVVVLAAVARDGTLTADAVIVGVAGLTPPF